ncbi:hypothetical protein T10_13317, partial [Trichinella papuae]
ERCAANEQWRFQCDDGRRIAIKTALNTKIEDGRQRPEDDVICANILSGFPHLNVFTSHALSR